MTPDRIESLIGVLLPAPLTCTTEHLPATYNPWADQTWCLCGSHTWPGLTPVLHKSVCRRDGLGPNASIVGWDTYTLDTVEWQVRRRQNRTRVRQAHDPTGVLLMPDDPICGRTSDNEED